MNQYLKHLNRMEFVVTYACTGRCRHCSEGNHSSSGPHIDAEAASAAVYEAAGSFPIATVMTFGGEPLLFPETVYAVHRAASELEIPRRQLITNGFFSRDGGEIDRVARGLAEAGVNEILLSVDAFHQETIPLEPVREFALAAAGYGAGLRVHPAWVVSRTHENPYNRRTSEIVAEFEALGIVQSDGNIIVPIGNAKQYLSDYYDVEQDYADPYEEDPADIRAISIDPDGGVLGGNIYQTGIVTILEDYAPPK